MSTLALPRVADAHAIRNMQFDFLRATEMAALNAISWIGKGEKEAADAAACDAIRGMFDAMEMRGSVVIGEGIKDQAPGLFAGERVGQWGDDSPRIDIAVDPLDGTTNLSKGLPNVISCVAAALRSDERVPALQYVPAFYMKKLAYPAVVRQAWVNDPKLPLDIKAPLPEVIALTAKVLGKRVPDVVVMVLDRPRNAEVIEEVRRSGASLRMIGDGDIAAALGPAIAGSGVDLYIGIGGAPEGILAAAGLRCIGGGMQAQMWPRDDAERASLAECGWSSRVDNVYRSRDLVSGDDIIFIATGISDSPLLRGVESRGSTVITHSVLMRLRSGTVRYVRTEHDLQKRPLRLRTASSSGQSRIYHSPSSTSPPPIALYNSERTGACDSDRDDQEIVVPALLLVGPPGSGKGTIGDKLEALLEFKHVSSGDLIRDAISREGPLSHRWSPVRQGGLISDDDLWELFDSYLAAWREAHRFAVKSSILIIDGIPRRTAQIRGLNRRVSVAGVISLECEDREMLIERLRSRARSQGRIDDVGEQVLHERLQVFDNETRPVLDAYPRDIVRRIDAGQDLPEVLRDVLLNLLTLGSLQKALNQQLGLAAGHRVDPAQVAN